MGAAFNGWISGNTVHWPALHNHLVPLCVAATSDPVPHPDENTEDWYQAIPAGHAICDDEVLTITCVECREWIHA